MHAFAVRRALRAAGRGRGVEGAKMGQRHRAAVARNILAAERAASASTGTERGAGATLPPGNAIKTVTSRQLTC